MKPDNTQFPIVKTFSEYLPDPLIEVESSGGNKVTYYGYAAIGVSESEEKWLIKKVEETTSGDITTITTTYAQGTMDFVSAWSNRSIYSYSR